MSMAVDCVTVDTKATEYPDSLRFLLPPKKAIIRH